VVLLGAIDCNPCIIQTGHPNYISQIQVQLTACAVINLEPELNFGKQGYLEGPQEISHGKYQIWGA